jgi:hypothetical protein
MYNFTVRLPRFAAPTLARRQLLASLAGRPAEIDRFIGACAGVVPTAEYFHPGNILRSLAHAGPRPCPPQRFPGAGTAGGVSAGA